MPPLDPVLKFTMTAPIVGARWQEGAELMLAKMRDGERVTVWREPTNPQDRNACAVHYAGHKLGFVPARLASKLADAMDRNRLSSIDGTFAKMGRDSSVTIAFDDPGKVGKMI